MLIFAYYNKNYEPMKITKLILFSLFLISSGLSGLKAQECGMDYYMEKHLHIHPNSRQIDDSLIASSQVDQLLNRRNKLIIPIVFHVLHQNGPENISDAQIENAIKILNEDFSLTNADFANTRNTTNAPFKDRGSNFNIEFRLARLDPQGNCTNGINRIETPLTNDARNNVKEIIRWPVDRYINIWVVKTIENNSGGQGIILGFANFPWMPLSTDGIVIRADYTGAIETANNIYKGRTLTHEMGHCLNLYHTFQGGCTQQGGGDGVDDTPPVSEAGVNANCPSTGHSCPFHSLNIFDMWENYMDYSRGSCQTMFTHGQKTRAYAALNAYSHRKNLFSNQNLIQTGVIPNPSAPPKPFFSSNTRIACAGEPVVYSEMQCQGVIDSRIWSFEGGDILSSSQPNPIVVYNQPGKYKVKLAVYNSFGADSLEEIEYITVKPAASINTLVESFESSDWNDASEWETQNPLGWDFKVTSDAAHFGTKSIVADCNNSPQGTLYSLITPSININEVKHLNPRISFMVGYARKSAENIETLRLYVSNDCGNTFKQVLQRSGIQLVSQINSQKFISDFTPQSINEWIRVHFSLWEYLESTSVMFKIEVISGNGNPLYIDDINVSQYFTGLNELDKNIDLQVAPNPSNDIFNISINTSLIGKNFEMYVTDISGRKVTDLNTEFLNDNQATSIFDPNAVRLSSGIYYLMLKTPHGTLSKKLVFVK
jgi:PKD repeat protein